MEIEFVVTEETANQLWELKEVADPEEKLTMNEFLKKHIEMWAFMRSHELKAKKQKKGKAGM